MEFLTFTAEKDDANRRFDRLIACFLPQMPTAIVQKNIRTGFIRLNQKKAKPNSLIQEKDRISIARVLYQEYKDTKEVVEKNKVTVSIKTLFKNEHLWIVHKEKGMLSQKAKKNDTSLNCILKEASQHSPSLSFVPSILHRLDRETSGLIVFSQSLRGAQWFSSIMQENTLGKYYIGIAEGRLLKDEIWDDTIDGERCITEVRLLEEGRYKEKNLSLIEYKIITGKKHQIRKQGEKHQLSLLGDKKYGGFTDDFIQNYALHAYKLAFPENNLGIPSIVKDSIPEYFEDMAKTCLLKLDSPLIL